MSPQRDQSLDSKFAGQCPLRVPIVRVSAHFSRRAVVLVCACRALECIIFASSLARFGSVLERVIVWCLFGFFAGMLRRVFCFVSLACGQTFPNGVGDLLAQLQSKLGDVDGMRADNSAALEILSKDAAAEAAAAAEHEREADTLRDAVFAAASRAVAEMKYVGGCPRIMDGCPHGWSPNGSGECAPPAAYDGSCAATDLSSFTTSQKEEFSLKCGAAWPCQVCSTNFAGCPLGWRAVGRLCVAPDAYDGMCSPVMEFGAMSQGDLSHWAAICSARWPCA